MEKTLACLAKALVGESLARNRYTVYSKVAKKEGFEQISEIFLLTAANEYEHASWHIKMINELLGKSKAAGQEIEVPAGVGIPVGPTKQNLKAAIAGESYETSKMYPGFARIAKAEGYPKIAARLLAIAQAEAHHLERYKKILKAVETKSVFKKNKKVWWVCRECGYMHYGTTPPPLCPSCDHAESYYQLKCEEF